MGPRKLPGPLLALSPPAPRLGLCGVTGPGQGGTPELEEPSSPSGVRHPSGFSCGAKGSCPGPRRGEVLNPQLRVRLGQRGRRSPTSPGLPVQLLPRQQRKAQPGGTGPLPSLYGSFPSQLGFPQVGKVRAAGSPFSERPTDSFCRGIRAAKEGPDGSPSAQENSFRPEPAGPRPMRPAQPRRGGALPGTRGCRSSVEPGGEEGGGPAACENCYFSSITRNLCKCPGQDTSRPAGWGHRDNTAMEKSKLHLLTSSQIQITALAWRGEGSERSM